MANDRQVLGFVTPAELVALMNATGVITVHEAGTSDGKPVIHASVKVVNAETGEQLPGGLPFSVVMFKGPNEPGCSNIAIGTIVPASELKVALPRDYFNFCNQRFRFTRVFPVDESAFVIQMDLVLKNATREYVKFSFGLWGALFSQMLFELMGRGRESLIAAAEAYAMAHTDFAAQLMTPMPVEMPPEPAAEAVPETAVEAAPETPADVAAAVPEVLALEAEAIVMVEPVAATEPPAAVEEPVAEVPAEAPVEAAAVEETPTVEPALEAAETGLPVEPVTEVADAVVDGPELSIAAGPTEAAEPAVVETKDAMPA